MRLTDLGIPADYLDAFWQDGFVQIPALLLAGPPEPMDTLVPRAKSKSVDNTYYARFGFDDYPLHTDGAILPKPPRFILFEAQRGCLKTATKVLSFESLPNEIVRLLAKCLVRPRRYNNRRRVHVALASPTGNPKCMRWDSVFLQPLSGRSEAMFSEISEAVGSVESKDITLKEKGSMLLIDNWRVMHGRSAVPETGRGRIIRRTYLES